MNRIESTGDTDFVWDSDFGTEPTTLIVFFQGEQGFASFIAGMSVVGEAKTICRIYSKLQSVEPINTIPSPTFPEWRLYCVYNADGRRYLILRMVNTYIASPQQQKAWLYNYPIARDIVTVLSKYGVDEMVYLTANLMQEFVYSEQTQIPDDKLIVYDYYNKEDSLMIEGKELEDSEMILPPPSWVFAEIFNNFCVEIKANWLVICSATRHTFVNTEAIGALTNFLNDVHALTIHQEKIEEYEMALHQLEANAMGGE